MSGQLHASAALMPVGWCPQPVWKGWSSEISCMYQESNPVSSVILHITQLLHSLNCIGSVPFKPEQ